MISWAEEYVADQTGLTRPLKRDELQKWQLEALNQLLSYASARSRFYRDYPKALTDLDQLSTLPLMNERTLAEAGQSMVCVSQSQIERVVTMETSGTAGKAKRLYYTADDLERTVDFFAKGLREVVAPGQRMLLLLPSQRPDGVGDLILRGLDRLGARGINAPAAGSFAQYSALLAQGVEAVVGMPGQILALARFMRAQGADAKPKGVLVSADWLSSWAREALESLWGAVLVEHYGSTECALGGALQCQTRGGRHIRESDLLCEIIHPATGQPVPDGVWGELVITTLRREAMPLIRYRTGDWTRIMPDNCPCGSSLRMLDEVRRIKMHPLWPILDEVLWPVEAVVDFALRRSTKGPLLQILAAEPLSEETVRKSLRPYPQAAKLVVRVSVLQSEQAVPLNWGKRCLL